MKPIHIAAAILAVVGLYSLMQGRKGTDMPSIIETWLPIAGAAYFFFAKGGAA
jgi:hypothetical protein